MVQDEQRLNEDQFSNGSQVDSSGSDEDSPGNVSMDLDFLRGNDSFHGVPSDDGENSNCSAEETSSFTSAESSSTMSTSSEPSTFTSSQNNPYTSVSSSDSAKESSISMSSQSTSYTSVVYQDFVRSLPNVPSTPSTSDRLVGRCLSSSNFLRKLSTPSQSTSDSSFVGESSSGEQSTFSPFQMTSTDDSIGSGHSPGEPPILKPHRSIADIPRSISITSQPSRSAGGKGMESEKNLPEAIEDVMTSSWSTPEEARDQRNIISRNSEYRNPMSRFGGPNSIIEGTCLDNSSEENGSEVREIRERFFGSNQDKRPMLNYLLDTSPTSSTEDVTERDVSYAIAISKDQTSNSRKNKIPYIHRISKSSSPISESEGSNNNLDDAFVVSSEEMEHIEEDVDDTTTSILNRILQAFQSSRFGEHYEAEMGRSRAVSTIEEQPQILSQPESSCGERTPISESPKSDNNPDPSCIDNSPNTGHLDNEIDELETFVAHGASGHDSRSFRSQPRSSFNADSRDGVIRSFPSDIDRDRISRRSEQFKRKRFHCRTSTYKNVGIDNILVRAHVISSPESEDSEDEAQELSTLKSIRRYRSASNSLLSQPSLVNRRTNTSRPISNGREQTQMSSEGERASRERSRSRNPCVSFIDHEIIEEESDDEENNATENRMENFGMQEDNAQISDALPTENQDFEMETEDIIHPSPNSDGMPSDEIERLRNQRRSGQQFRRYRISSDSSSSREEELRYSLREILPPNGSPGPLFRPCPWSPSILTWSTPTGSWYGDEPFPDHFPRLSTPSPISSIDLNSPEDHQSIVFSFEEQPQLANSNQQSFESFAPSPERSNDQENPEEESLRMPIYRQSVASLNTPPQHSSDGGLRHELRPFEITSEHSPHASTSRQPSTCLDTPPHHSSNGESMHQLSSISPVREEPLPVSSDPSFGTHPQYSNSQEVRHDNRLLSLLEEQSQQITIHKQLTASLDASSQDSNSPKPSPYRNSLSLLVKQQSRISSNQRSSQSLSTHSQNSNGQESDNQWNLISSEGLPTTGSREVPANEHNSPCSKTNLPYASPQSTLINRPIRGSRSESANQGQMNTDRVSNTQKRLYCQMPTRMSKRQATITSSSIEGSAKSLQSSKYTVSCPFISSSKSHTSITHPSISSETSSCKISLTPVRIISRKQLSSIARKSSKMSYKCASKTQRHHSTSRSSSTSSSTTKHSKIVEQSLSTAIHKEVSSTATIQQLASTVTPQQVQLAATQHQATISVSKQQAATSVVTRQQSASTGSRQQSASKNSRQQSSSTATQQQQQKQTSTHTQQQKSVTAATKQQKSVTAATKQQNSASTATQQRKSASTATQQQSASTSNRRSNRARKTCTTNQVTTSQVKQQVVSTVTTRSHSVVQKSTSASSQVLSQITMSSRTKHVSTSQTRLDSKKVLIVRKSTSSSKNS